ncbi:hypothetical protein N7495_000423 [Penicillium taxi]|uniref:uncharacterized protein n=1 Tax=Penicillium taxi TaxID=168475 RepID=UPI0025451BC8|nr:uncharacterized protein N7495_000423 [Penicillium taxi]KAJ5907741.1 hypothetical protein N7495_000423 [Penicillium taxi]
MFARYILKSVHFARTYSSYVKMSVKKTAPYGQWSSPLTAARMAQCSISLHEVVVEEVTGTIYSVECHPTEGGRYAIMEHINGSKRDVLSPSLSAFAMVNELGGGSIAMRPGGKIIFSDEESRNVYLLEPAAKHAELVLSAAEGHRYGDFCIHKTDPKWALAIKEDHQDATPETQATDVHNTLIVINLETGTETTIAHGDDFYSHPKFDPSGRYVSWIQWTHPDMPWTGTVLYLADWVDGTLANVTRIAGKWQEESIAQPKWGLDGLLYFASDRSGFWQLFSFDPKSQNLKPLLLKGFENSDFAVAEWELGSSTYISLDDTTIVATAITHATSKVVFIDTSTLTVRELDLPYVDVDAIYRVSDTSFAIIGASATFPQELAIVSITPSFEVQRTVLTSTVSFDLQPEYVSIGNEYTAKQKYGPHHDGQVHMFYFPPCNPEYQADSKSLPPLLAYVHGGPNGCVSPALNLEFQYWTTRGFAVCAINYTGSTGYGREYRERLSGHWGLLDVGDAVSAVEYLADQGLIDKSHVGIYGGSAGGYLTLRALHMYPDVWAAGVSSYGISDVSALQADSYKFESQDVDRLLLSKTEAKDRAAELIKRSPCHFADEIKGALLLLQGTKDVVVPVAQARMMADAMKSHGRLADVVVFEGEGHGWVGEKAIRESFELKDEWWKRHLT